MFYNFSINNLTTSLKDRQIEIDHTLDIDKNRSNDILIEVFERETRSPLIFDSWIEGSRLIIQLRDWPIPNTEYVLGVKGVTSVTGDMLDRNLKTKFSFKSEITSKTDIVHPAHFEKVNAPFIELKEIKRTDKEEELINNFYIEIGLDNNFIDVPYKTFIEGRNSITAGLERYGQYFLRARVQKELPDEEIMYGEWSETITFVYGKEEEDGGLPPIIDPDDPVEEPDLEPEVVDDIFEILSVPEVGVTPESFVFEFSEPINDLMIDDLIMVIRKDVK